MGGGVLPGTLIDAVHLLGVKLRGGEVLYTKVEASALQLGHDGVHLGGLDFGVQVHC